MSRLACPSSRPSEIPSSHADRLAPDTSSRYDVGSDHDGQHLGAAHYAATVQVLAAYATRFDREGVGAATQPFLVAIDAVNSGWQLVNNYMSGVINQATAERGSLFRTISEHADGECRGSVPI